MNLTKDTYEYLLNFADDRTLLNMLSANKKFAQKLNDDDFFRQLLEKRYPLLLEFKKEDESFKNLYLREIYYISKIEEKFHIPYYPLKDYNPEYFFKSHKNNDDFFKEILNEAAYSNNLIAIKDIIKSFNFEEISIDHVAYIASHYGYLEILKFLISIGANDINKYLNASSRAGQLKIVKYLIETYKIKNVNQAISYATEYNRTNVLNYLENL